MFHQLVFKARRLECINAPCADCEVDRTSSGMPVGSGIIPPLDDQDIESLSAQQACEQAPCEAGPTMQPASQ